MRKEKANGGEGGGIAKVSSLGAPGTNSEPYETKFFYYAKTTFFN